jgi:kynurenine formamidase
MKTRTAFLLAASIVGVFTMCNTAPGTKSRAKLGKEDVEKIMQSVSNWGRWGAEDQLGTLNLITPEKRKQAAGLVEEGKPVSLSHNVMKKKWQGSPPFVHKMLGTGQSPDAVSVSDEYSVQYHGFSQTHMDSLAHLVHQGKMYNGVAQQTVTEEGAQKLGILNAKQGIFTRAVLMDIPRLRGVPYLKGAEAIYPEDLDAWLEKAGVKVESGDVVLIHTGRWAREQAEGEWDVEKGSAGLHASCLPWLKEHNVAVVGSDLALDVLPSGVEGFPMPVHWGVITALGMPILDNLDLQAAGDEAASRKRWSFLITAAPLAVEGGTGSPVNPIAMF